MHIIDGKKIAQQIKEEVKQNVAKLREDGIIPVLNIVQVGYNPASTTYVNNKMKSCREVGITPFLTRFEEEVTEDEILEFIHRINNYSDGVIVQLPLPKHISEEKVIQAITPEVDVDGFNVVNSGNLMSGLESTLPCTPAGIIEMLKRSDIQIAGKHCVIIGRSNIVGKPLAILMLKENATVTIAHSKTENLKEVCKNADILVVAIGKPEFIDSSYVKQGAVVVDVGINRINGKLVGDVDFESVKDVASAITPVPGGVGPLTVAMLMKNCCDLAKTKNKLRLALEVVGDMELKNNLTKLAFSFH